MFVFATMKTNFLFQGEMYDQIDGVAMGSPLAPILANIFMGFHEKRWPESSSIKPIVYKRYVDDIFAVFSNELEADEFLRYLNSQHSNIQFTVEKEQQQKLPFLDVLLEKSGGLITSVYHKSTYTGLLTNFLSFVPSVYKMSLVRTLIDRTYKINSSWQRMHFDFEDLKTVLGRNLFPPRIVESYIKRYIGNCFEPHVPDKEIPATNKRFYKLPFVGRNSDILKTKINKLVAKYCKDITVEIVFTTCKLREFFSYKDKVTQSLRSMVVYKFKCAGCDASYVGETKRHLQTRVKEHLTCKDSHVFKHLLASPACKAVSNADSFSVLDSAETEYQLKLKEGLYIAWENPSLNVQVRCERFSLAI